MREQENEAKTFWEDQQKQEVDAKIAADEREAQAAAAQAQAVKAQAERDEAQAERGEEGEGEQSAQAQNDPSPTGDSSSPPTGVDAVVGSSSSGSVGGEEQSATKGANDVAVIPSGYDSVGAGIGDADQPVDEYARGGIAKPENAADWEVAVGGTAAETGAPASVSVGAADTGAANTGDQEWDQSGAAASSLLQEKLQDAWRRAVAGETSTDFSGAEDSFSTAFLQTNLTSARVSSISRGGQPGAQYLPIGTRLDGTYSPIPPELQHRVIVNSGPDPSADNTPSPPEDQLASVVTAQLGDNRKVDVLITHNGGHLGNPNNPPNNPNNANIGSLPNNATLTPVWLYRNVTSRPALVETSDHAMMWRKDIPRLGYALIEVVFSAERPAPTCREVKEIQTMLQGTVCKVTNGGRSRLVADGDNGERDTCHVQFYGNTLFHCQDDVGLQTATIVDVDKREIVSGGMRIADSSADEPPRPSRGAGDAVAPVAPASFATLRRKVSSAAGATVAVIANRATASHQQEHRTDHTASLAHDQSSRSSHLKKGASSHHHARLHQPSSAQTDSSDEDVGPDDDNDDTNAAGSFTTPAPNATENATPEEIANGTDTSPDALDNTKSKLYKVTAHGWTPEPEKKDWLLLDFSNAPRFVVGVAIRGGVGLDGDPAWATKLEVQGRVCETKGETELDKMVHWADHKWADKNICPVVSHII